MKGLFLLCHLTALAFASQSNWMSHLDNSQPLSGLSIPGTHNTMALYGRLAKCQRMSLEQQLDAGIRFLDIRCRQYGNSLPIHHGIKYQNTGFDKVLKTIKDFLEKNPNEFVLMRVKKEYKDYSPVGSMSSVVESHLKQYLGVDKVWMSISLPKTIGEARGKLVILRDFNGPNWVSYNSLQIDDHWKVRTLLRRSISKKWGYIQTHLDKARQDDGETTYLTYASGASAGAYPKHIAKRINPRLENHIKSNPVGNSGWGVIAMDFPGSSLIYRIIASNPLKQPRILTDSNDDGNEGSSTVRKPSSVY